MSSGAPSWGSARAATPVAVVPRQPPHLGKSPRLFKHSSSKEDKLIHPLPLKGPYTPPPVVQTLPPPSPTYAQRGLLKIQLRHALPTRSAEYTTSFDKDIFLTFCHKHFRRMQAAIADPLQPEFCVGCFAASRAFLEACASGDSGVVLCRKKKAATVRSRYIIHRESHVWE